MKTFRFFAVISLIALGMAFFEKPALADSSLPELGAPGSAHEVPNWFELGLEEEPVKETRLDKLLENSTLNLKLRNYYLNRAKPTAIDSYAWTQGGSVEYKLGRLWEVFDFNAEWFASFPLYAPREHDGTLLLEPGQDEIMTLGVLNPRLTLFEDHVISSYRQKYDLPYVNQQDNRMVPNTFEGYTIAMPRSNNDKFQYVAGYIDRIKTRNAESFVSMSEAAGIDDAKRGMLLGGARWYPIPAFSIAAINYYVEDVLNIYYGEAIYKFKFSEKVENTLSFQNSTQNSVGDDLIRGDSYSGSMWGAQNATSYEGIVFKLAVNVNDSGALLRSPWGSYPGYNSVIVEDFNRAGENSWQVGLSYDFKRIGLDGFSLTTAYVQGNDAVDEVTKESLNDKQETDLTLDYRVPKGHLLERFWLRLRGAWIDEDNVGTTDDYRIIINYDIPLWKPEEKDKVAS